MKIAVDRIEQVIITGNHELIESTAYDYWDDAFEYLEARLGLEITSEMRDEFRMNANTHTNPRPEMVNRGDHAYSAQVFYDVNVSEVAGGGS